MPHAALCVSRLLKEVYYGSAFHGFNAARSIVCVETLKGIVQIGWLCMSFNAARSIVCVETVDCSGRFDLHQEFQCRTQHCVCRDT